MSEKEPFKFEISLSVLNHLGRNLYRNFITVIGEAISNSWDADANNVWIYIDRGNNTFFIKDDGEGMTKKDFQGKFLKVGYSKREEFGMSSKSGRPYIGAKGIGKLALLSCAEKISIMSKTEKTSYVGGVINNTGLDKAIKKQLTTDEYSLDEINPKLFKNYLDGHNKGTLIAFENIKDSIRNTIPYLKMLMALYFRFSLLDKKFNIFINDEKVTLDDLKNLSESTEFLWNINGLKDIYLSDHLSKVKESETLNVSGITAKGFIASVVKPRFLKITGTEEKAGIDLFVNGRLRERNILRHLPDFSTRHIASYIYGQIHFNDLDKDVLDKVFTSSREGVVEDNIEYKELLDIIKKDVLEKISNRWDEWRLKHNEIGDEENPQKSKKARYASSLYKESVSDYSNTDNDEVKKWIKELRKEAEFNIPAYADCFLSENLIRKYIENKPIQLNTRATNEIVEHKRTEQTRKATAQISFDISQGGDMGYLGMDTLADVVDGPARGGRASLSQDAIEYKPMRNAVGHTSLLTTAAKTRLRGVYENIKARVNTLLSDG